MFKLFMNLMLINTSFIYSVSHPMILGLILFIQTMLICSLSRLILQSSWVSLTLFIVMIGGLMIIFVYITSICSNKKFHFFNFKLSTFYLIMFFMFINNNNEIFYWNENIQLKDMKNLEFTKLFSSMNLISSTFMFLYLLIMLIIMINILMINKGPMRKKY